MAASWEHRWPTWEASPESGLPAERGGCTEDAAYDAGLIEKPPGWTQEIQFYDPRLDPDSDQYSPRYEAELAFEQPGPESLRQMQAYAGWAYRHPDAGKEPPDWEAEAF